MSNATTTDVLIVGAGPTGTALAIDLIRRGVAVRLIDKEPHTFAGSRAKGVQPRTLEVLDDLGAISDVLSHGSLYPKMGIHLGSKLGINLGPVTIPWRMIAKGTPGPDVPYPDTWLIPQSSTVGALHARLEASGGRAELGTELIDFTADTHVTAYLSTRTGSQDVVTARYLVGADGGSSRVRKTLGIDFVGSTDDADRILLVDAEATGGLSRNYWHVWPGRGKRFIGACPLPGSELFQWMIRLAPGQDAPQGQQEISENIRAHTHNPKLGVRNIVWKSVFRPNVRLAESYRHGHVLLAGDAAHVHTPAGAQGLNTGVGDAYNLGWKLGQVLAGADDDLLDTYQGERRPIAAAVLGMSTKKYEGIGTLDPSSIKRGKDEKQLTLTYFGGPLAAAAGDRTATLRAGDRAPDAELLTDDGAPVRMFDIYRGPHFTAIAYGAHAAAELNQIESPSRGAQLRRVNIDALSGDGASGDANIPRADEVLTDPTGMFARIYGITADTLLLIRPDGYIGHIATHDLAATTRRALQRITPHL